jgi:predicted ATP-dependent protease
MPKRPEPLKASELHRTTDPASFPFRSTDELTPSEAVFGQSLAMEALDFGLSIVSPGHNVFVLGSPGSGRLTFIRQALAERARTGKRPSDWCYVFNFDDSRRPQALELPAGQARKLQQDMEELLEDLRRSVPEALRAEDVAGRRQAILSSRGKEATELMERLRENLVEDQYVALIGDLDAQIVVPARGGEAIDREQYRALPEDHQKTIDEHVDAAGKRVQAAQREVHEIGRRAREEVGELHQQVARNLVIQRIGHLEEKHANVKNVAQYLERVAEDMVRHATRFASAEDENDPLAAIQRAGREDFFRRYQINALVCHPPDATTPVAEVSNPNLRNLFGRTEGELRFGIMVTDFTRISPGAVQRANGGYLVLEAGELFSRPLVWPALKRALRTRELTPADAASELGLSVSDSLEPQPIPARLKVVIYGEPRLYYLLRHVDSEFASLFKVKVDFSPWMERSRETETQYADFIAGQCRSQDLPPFDADAVARVVEEGARLVGNQNKLSTRFGEVADLLKEAAHQAGGAGESVVTGSAVAEALAARDRREQRPHREILDLIHRGTLDFQPEGQAVGELYGIGLIQVGRRPFGRPIRVMASAFLGTGGVVNIEREARLSGPIHNKGFLVLSGYLGQRFAQKLPLILSASLSFDQLYEEVEGDSASAAELYALMSAIGGFPLERGIAVTGALNQDGVILPVGGVTEKIEGFFAACEAVGYEGPTGVVVPRKNLENLTLSTEVRTAAESGRFKVYAIDQFEEGWPILSGLDAGEPDEDGSYPPDSVDGRVMSQLKAWARQWKAFGGPDAGPGEEQVAVVEEMEEDGGVAVPDDDMPGSEGKETP